MALADYAPLARPRPIVDAHRRERRTAWLGALALLAVLALRAWVALTLGVNSDEPQHLHIVWAWTQGLLPYRDLFDNHAPLFQALYAPLLAALGERADVVPLMRLAAFPWYLATLLLTWQLAIRLFDRRVALLAVALVALEPTFFSRGVEFRPDQAWATAWLAALVVAVSGTPNARRGFTCGLLAGLAAAFSIKTAILLAGAAAAALILIVVLALRRRPIAWSDLVRVGAATAAGGAAVPALVVAAFAAAGAAAAMRYCLLVHNATPGLGRWADPGLEVWLFPASLVLFALLAQRLLRSSREPLRPALRLWIAGSALLYLAGRASYQPLLDSQDLLPIVPMLAPFAAALPYVGGAGAGRRQALRAGAIAAAILLEIGLVLDGTGPWRNEAQEYARELGTLLRLTRPGEFVMDDKAESIFRPRPLYFVLENVTRYRMQQGLIAGDLELRLANYRVAVGVFAREQPQELEFVRRNYVEVAKPVAVAGKLLGHADGGIPVTFDVAVPQTYSVLGRSGSTTGSLDGSPYTAPRELGAGEHVFVPQRADDWAILWRRAAELGYSPFASTPGG